ncbi:hypothetical protein J3R82DRAFT_8932 [Butyriboletus roseoflavus]|nr:hypothetical protein J3R82DRAFT_8932 [Butyriboletus roseoflavus]
MAFRSFAIVSTLLSTVLAQSSVFRTLSFQLESPPTAPSISQTWTTIPPLHHARTLSPQPCRPSLHLLIPRPLHPPPSSAPSTRCARPTHSLPCPQSTVTTQLISFYAACPDELTSTPNQPVKLLYDLLYSLVPLRQAVCSKDDNGNYCATELSNSSSVGTVAAVDTATSQKQTLLTQYLYTQPGAIGASARRDLSNTTTALVPNTTTYHDTNLMFLFLSGDMPNSELCVTCTRNILTSYITFESAMPYAPGINNSLVLSGQIALYNNVTSKCGASFLSGVVQAAGGLSSGLLSGAASRAGGLELSAAVSAILGVAAFMAASV